MPEADVSLRDDARLAHAQSTEHEAELLAVELAHGLSTVEAEIRVRRFGPNETGRRPGLAGYAGGSRSCTTR